ncbi:MAG: hypothetical protein JWP92_2494 [Caulobacter sp.]|jgi:hypothetical protein|nr:hypothetical protein [Caulobacter sp.]
MLTAVECLAKAAEMDDRALQCGATETRVEFFELAQQWRELARRALAQDQRDQIITPSV